MGKWMRLNSRRKESQEEMRKIGKIWMIQRKYIWILSVIGMCVTKKLGDLQAPVENYYHDKPTSPNGKVVRPSWNRIPKAFSQMKSRKDKNNL